MFRETAINDRPTLAVNTTSIRGDGGKDTCPRCGGEPTSCRIGFVIVVINRQV